MKTIEVLKAFAYSDNGYDVTQYAAGDIATVSDACAGEESDLGNARMLDNDALAKAHAANARLAAAADKAEAAADKAEAAAADLRGKADIARAKVRVNRIDTQVEADAAALPDGDPVADQADQAERTPAPAADPQASLLVAPAP